MEQHPIKINKVQIRNLQIEDYVQLSQSFTRVYSDGSDVFWTREQIQKLIKNLESEQASTVLEKQELQKKQRTLNIIRQNFTALLNAPEIQIPVFKTEKIL